jgi:hypothetical protein
MQSKQEIKNDHVCPKEWTLTDEQVENYAWRYYILTFGRRFKNKLSDEKKKGTIESILKLKCRCQLRYIVDTHETFNNRLKTTYFEKSDQDKYCDPTYELDQFSSSFTWYNGYGIKDMPVYMIPARGIGSHKASTAYLDLKNVHFHLFMFRGKEDESIVGIKDEKFKELVLKYPAVLNVAIKNHESPEFFRIVDIARKQSRLLWDELVKLYGYEGLYKELSEITKDFFEWVKEAREKGQEPTLQW